MPKLKAHRGAAKRFRPIAGGQGFKFRRMNRNHILTKKSPDQKRRLRVAGGLVSDADKPMIARMITGS